jgi:hypothetical protein
MVLEGRNVFENILMRMLKVSIKLKTTTVG